MMMWINRIAFPINHLQCDENASIDVFMALHLIKVNQVVHMMMPDNLVDIKPNDFYEITDEAKIKLINAMDWIDA